MKFAQQFQEALERDDYPQEWIDSAISYKKLKKCIKRVQQELLILGLDTDTLNTLWQHVGTGSAQGGGDDEPRLVHYSLEGNEKISFTPKLTIAIDPKDGSPMDAWLSPETKRVLRRLAQSSKASMTQSESRTGGMGDERDDQDSAAQDSSATDSDHASNDGGQQVATIEVPLTSDSEFFQILRRELTDLDQLEDGERKDLQSEIATLGNGLRELKSSKSKRSKEEVEAWRKIFELYIDAEVFLSSHEKDAGVRDAGRATRQFHSFTKSLATLKEVLRLGKGSSSALERFMHVNVNLLRLMKFQEINRTALTKIMKKFDKRTALHARLAVSKSLNNAPFMAQDLARVASFTMSEELLNIIPQLNDYLCPICFNLSYKPVRLRCNHIFCIRCLIVMQREEQDHCPLCRENVVLEATSSKVQV